GAGGEGPGGRRRPAGRTARPAYLRRDGSKRRTSAERAGASSSSSGWATAATAAGASTAATAWPGDSNRSTSSTEGSTNAVTAANGTTSWWRTALKLRATEKASSSTARSQYWCCSMILISSGYMSRRNWGTRTPGWSVRNATRKWWSPGAPCSATCASTRRTTSRNASWMILG